MPTGRAGFATGVVEHNLYTIGGSSLDNCVVVGTVEAYDPYKDKWKIGLAPLPAPLRWRPAGASLSGLIYVVGGESKEDGCGGKALDVMQAYDPATDKWSTKPSMLTRRLQLGAGADTRHNLLYAVGGADDDFTPLATVEVFDPAGEGGVGKWENKASLNIPRAVPAVAALNGKVYAIGGQKNDHTALDTVEEFDPNANGGFGAWTIKPSHMPHPRRNSAFTILDGKVYIIGGEVAEVGIIATVDVYDPSTDSWITVAPMLTARRGLGAETVGDTIFAVGGQALVASVGEQFTYQITATNGPTYFDAIPLPPGLNIDHERGIIYGAPTDTSDGFVTTFFASNGAGSALPKEVSFLIEGLPPAEDSPQIISRNCVTGRAGQPFRFQVLSYNADSDQLLAATGLPYAPGIGPAVTIDPGTGVISGMVPDSSELLQSYGVGLNILGADLAKSFLQLTFVTDPFFPVITSRSTAVLVLNQFFSYTITADADVSSFSYFGVDGAPNGSLPAGLTFDSLTGTISGIYKGEEGIGDQIETIKKEPPPRIQLCVEKDGTGTATLPLSFLISLHDFEAETLVARPSPETDYGVITDDPVLSALGAGLLKSTKVGDEIVYTVPVPRSGTYDLRVGIRTGPGQGMVQLYIDGLIQGQPVDQYSTAIGYQVMDLGPVTFSVSGPKEFQFSIVGQNPNSSGYEIVCDYLDLVPLFEAEDLPIVEHSAPARVVHESSLSNGAGLLLQGREPGDYVTCSVSVATAGTYYLQVTTEPEKTTAKFKLMIDGTQQGYGQDGMQSLHDLGAIEFAAPGEKAFKFMVTKADVRSRGLDLLLDHVDLVLTNHFEAESLISDGNKALKQIPDGNLSGGEGLLLKATEIGDYVTCQVKVPVPGTYDLKVGLKKGKQYGIVQLSINDVNYGSPQDTYSSAIDYEVVDFGRLVLTQPGENTFRFLVTGRNPSSTGYQVVLDYIDLAR